MVEMVDGHLIDYPLGREISDDVLDTVRRITDLCFQGTGRYGHSLSLSARTSACMEEGYIPSSKMNLPFRFKKMCDKRKQDKV